MTVTPVTDRMADFAAQAQLTEMPDRVTRRARDLVRICVGAGARAAATSEALALHELLAGLDETPPPPEAAGPLLGPLGPLSHSTAVTFNAACMALGNAGQDGSSSGPGPGNAVVSCVFAAGELGPATSRSLLEGVVVGTETSLRIARALQQGPGTGWSAQRIAGRIGAAVAVVKALGGGLAEFRQAIGLAATQAAGLAGPASLSAAGVLAGKTASDGWEAGLLSLTGWKGPDHPLEGDRGLFRLITGKPVAQEVVTGLGHDWILTQVTLGGLAADQAHRPPGGLASAAASSFLRCIEATATEKLTDLAERRYSPKKRS